VQLKHFKGFFFEAWSPAYMCVFGDRLCVYDHLPAVFARDHDDAANMVHANGLTNIRPIICLPLHVLTQLAIDNTSKRRRCGIRDVWKRWFAETGFDFRGQKVRVSCCFGRCYDCLSALSFRREPSSYSLQNLWTSQGTLDLDHLKRPRLMRCT
jgi:hypothetical protein